MLPQLRQIRQIRQALFGSDKDVYDPQIFHRITVGFVSAWVVMGGDLLGSCVYGPDVLARSSSSRAVLLVAGMATLATLAILATAYTRMVAQFPHGGGGYTAAKHVVGERIALVSGVALVLDAGLNVAVSVVSCVHAAADALPAAAGAAKLPVALLLVALLTFVNLRGVKESMALLVPILVAFVGSHLVVLGLGVAHRIEELPGALASVPGDVAQLAEERGPMGALGAMARAYALGGAIYTGLESISNGVPILREPKVVSARRTMVLLAGVPALLIGVILVGCFLYDVQPAPDRTLNAALFERVSAGLGGGRAWLRAPTVTLPLLAEAALLLLAAQTGFVDGPRILGALATDRFLPRRLTRLNGRLAPATGILLIAAIALGATLIARGALEPLVIVFVLSVLVTFTISQGAMLLHAVRRRKDGAAALGDAALHGLSLLLCAVILAGTIASFWQGSLVALGLVAAVVGLCGAIRRRYDTMAQAVTRAHDEGVTPAAQAGEGGPITLGALGACGPPSAILLLGERTDFGRLALRWLADVPSGLSGVILASVSLVDAEAVQGEARLLELEEQRLLELERVAAEARARGLVVQVEVRRGADVLETATALVVELTRARSSPSVVVGFRSALASAAIDPLLRDDLAVRLQARLERERIPMVVVSIPLDA